MVLFGGCSHGCPSKALWTSPLYTGFFFEANQSSNLFLIMDRTFWNTGLRFSIPNSFAFRSTSSQVNHSCVPPSYIGVYPTRPPCAWRRTRSRTIRPSSHIERHCRIHLPADIHRRWIALVSWHNYRAEIVWNYTWASSVASNMANGHSTARPQSNAESTL